MCRPVETGASVSYGKLLSFLHSPASFVPEDRPLVSLVIELVNIYREHYEQFRKSAYVTVQGLRLLNISRANRDRFFQLMEGRQLEVEDGRGERFLVTVGTESLPLKVTIRRAGRDGIAVSVPEELYSFPGEHHLYIGNRKAIRRLDPAETEALSVFLEQMPKGRGRRETEIQDRDVPLFYERVLKKILPYASWMRREWILKASVPRN